MFMCCIVMDFLMLLLCVVARFDFSWHDPEYHQETLENLNANKELYYLNKQKIFKVSFTISESLGESCIS